MHLTPNSASPALLRSRPLSQPLRLAPPVVSFSAVLVLAPCSPSGGPGPPKCSMVSGRLLGGLSRVTWFAKDILGSEHGAQAAYPPRMLRNSSSLVSEASPGSKGFCIAGLWDTELVKTSQKWVEQPENCMRARLRGGKLQYSMDLMGLSTHRSANSWPRKTRAGPMSSSNCSRETPSPHPKCSQISSARPVGSTPWLPGVPKLLLPLLLAALEARAPRELFELRGAQELRLVHVQRGEDRVHQLLPLQSHEATAAPAAERARLGAGALGALGALGAKHRKDSERPRPGEAASRALAVPLRCPL